MTRQTGRTSYVLLYSGLGFAQGEFEFLRCHAEVMTWFEKREEPTFDLVGHSWGGYLSLNIAARWPMRVRKMVLLSPLLYFAGENVTAPVFSEHQRLNPDLVMAPTGELAQSFTRMSEMHRADDLAAQVSAPTLILQAREDQVTPPSYAQALRLARAPELRLVDNDHSFLANRTELSREIADYLEKK